MDPVSSQATCVPEGRPRLSVVVPTYCEAENLNPLITQLREALAPRKVHYEIIIVDDDSPDNTKQVISRLADQGHPVRLITRVDERGLSTAVLRGFEAASGEILLCMDADLSHPPSAVPRILDRLSCPGVEFVIGSRYVTGGTTDSGWGALRWVNSKAATLLARPFTSVSDPMAGFFALPRAVYERAAPLDPIGYKIGLELLVKCRAKDVREIPIEFTDRKRGSSKLNLREQLNYIRHLKRLADFRFGSRARFVQFCLVGATGMVIDLSSYTLLLLEFPMPLARAMAIWVAMTWNFFLNRRVTFSDSRHRSAWVQYPRFIVSCLFGALINWSVNLLLVTYVSWFGRHLLLAACAGILLATVNNFLCSRFLVFKRS